MSGRFILIAAGILAVSGLPGIFISRRSNRGQEIATVLALLGAVMGLAGTILSSIAGETLYMSIPWLPWTASQLDSAFALKIDSLAVIFLLPVFLMAGLGSIFGMGYWRQKDHPTNGRKLRLFYGLLAASMVLVIIAHHGLLFLFAWEAMALSTYFLVTTEDEDVSVQRAGWIYLVATHMGTLCLFALFALLRYLTGSFVLAPITAGSIGFAGAACLFALGLLGFGLKAGIMPLHIWLPAAHASAPSHVSAFLSGVLLKIGIYGLLRLCSLFPQPPASWGVLLLILGVISSIVGVVFALAQHDLKRLLAYHSIENIGIIFMGIGLAMIGRSLHRPEWIVLGLAGALLHVWNHAIFKSLLFLAAGSVIHAVGTREMDCMGGLAKRMPRTALLFVIGAIAICGLPPLNGFVSEFFVYLGLFRTAGITGGASQAMPGVALAIPALAAVGALALACFVKVIGAVFLGQARRLNPSQLHESPPSMLAPMVTLAGLCVAIGVAPVLLAPVLQNAINPWVGFLSAGGPVLTALVPLTWLSFVNACLIFLAMGFLFMVMGFGVRRPAFTRAALTWDCGFANPAPRMQYTASSFAQMLVGLMAFVLRPREQRPQLLGPFPGRASFKSHVDDLVLEGWLLPALHWIERGFIRFRVFQYGRVQLYVLYVLIVLMLLLAVNIPLHQVFLWLVGA